MKDNWVEGLEMYKLIILIFKKFLMIPLHHFSVINILLTWTIDFRGQLILHIDNANQKQQIISLLRITNILKL